MKSNCSVYHILNRTTDLKTQCLRSVWQRHKGKHTIICFIVTVTKSLLKVYKKTQFNVLYAYDTSESFLRKSLAQVTFARKLVQVTFASAP